MNTFIQTKVVWDTMIKIDQFCGKRLILEIRNIKKAAINIIKQLKLRRVHKAFKYIFSNLRVTYQTKTRVTNKKMFYDKIPCIIIKNCF